jgi:DUSP domain
LEGLIVDEQFLKNSEDVYLNLHIKTSMKEDEDFVILTDEVWKYLHKIYGGQDIPRFSIEAEKETEEDETQYMIEIYLKKLSIYIFPKVKNHLILKKPSGVYMSRRATVYDFKLNIAQILYENKKEIKLVDLMNMSRLWRLDTGENVFDIEKTFEYESYGMTNLPMSIRGRVLELKEKISEINVADDDILLYEVLYNEYLKNNNGFAFT